MTTDPILERFEREEEARQKMPVYELHVILSLPNQDALVALMKELAEPIYKADSMAAFGGGDRWTHELDLLRQALHAFSGYFTSANSIPVERATIKADSEAVQFMKAALPKHAWTNYGAKDASEFRQEGAAAGTAPPCGSGEIQAQPWQATRGRGPHCGQEAEKQGKNYRDACSAEKASPEVSGGGEGVLEGRDR